MNTFNAVALVILSLVTGLAFVVISRQVQLGQSVKERTAALVETEARYRLLFDGGADAQFVLDQHGHILDVNQVAVARYGYDRDEFLHLTVMDLAPAALREKTPQRVQAALANDTQFDWWHQRKDGSEFPVEIRTRRVILDGQPLILSSVRDVTERRAAQDAARGYRERLEMAQAIAHVGSWEFDLATGKIWGSTEAFRIYGIPRPPGGDLPIDEIEARIPDREMVHQALVDLINEGKKYDLEFPIHPRAGEAPTYITSVAELVKDEIGNPVKVVGVIQDVTERKRAEEAFSNAEHKWKHILVNTPQIGVVLDPDAKIVYANQHLLQLTEWEAHEVMGRNWFDLFIPEEAREEVKGIFREVMRSRDTLGLSSYENEIVTRTGEVRDIAWSNVISKDAHGRVLDVACLGIDLTERKRAEEALRASEERFQRALDNIPDVVVICDRDLRIRFVNAATLKLTSRPMSDFIGQHEEEIWPPEVHQAYLPILQEALNKGVVTSIETELLLPDNPSRHLRITCVPLLDDRGEVREVMGVTHDFSDLKHAAEDLQRLNLELEERVEERTLELQARNRELETYTYSVSHDLKAPLRGIDGYSQLLLEDYAEHLDEEGRSFLHIIRRGAQQMNQLIEDLLDYSRLERRSWRTSKVNVRAVVESLLSEYADQVQSRSVLVTVDLPFTTIVADADGLAMALRNLFDNALKFTHQASPPTIQIGGQEADDNWVVWVRDNGIGFEMKFHDRIFDIFQRLHRAEDYPGTGVGLAIVAKSLERMGGRVWAEGAPGQGATFFLEIPRR